AIPPSSKMLTAYGRSPTRIARNASTSFSTLRGGNAKPPSNSARKRSIIMALILAAPRAQARSDTMSLVLHVKNHRQKAPILRDPRAQAERELARVPGARLTNLVHV